MTRGSGLSGRLFVLGLAVLVIAGGAAIWMVSAQRHRELRQLRNQVENVRREVLGAMLAEKVERITAGVKDDQERCLRVARWVAANINNRSNRDNTWSAFADRAGYCSMRAQLFCRMLAYLSIDARVFSMYNFGGPGGGHSCAQAYYHGAWHFFDVTYAGVFMKNGVVLSWDQIMADPEDAVRHLVVFSETLDRHGNADEELSTRRRADNRSRMAEVYTVATLKAAKTYGFWRRLPVKVLQARVDCAKLARPLVIGGQGRRQTTSQGIKLGLSEYLGYSLLIDQDYFHIRWNFVNCPPGRPLVVRYRLGRVRGDGLAYWARAEGGEVVEGARREIGLWDRWLGGEWRVVLMPRGSQCSLTLGYDFRGFGTGVEVDGIEISLGDKP